MEDKNSLVNFNKNISKPSQKNKYDYLQFL